jgi:hypothetical protein
MIEKIGKTIFLMIKMKNSISFHFQFEFRLMNKLCNFIGIKIFLI